jgi:hypothetical protein
MQKPISLTLMTPTEVAGERRISTMVGSWYLLAAFPIALQLFLSLHRLKDGWDDGAITAAFSRTWAQTGRVALTPGSPVVEGFSSVSWFLLVSLPYFFQHNPDGGLIWMKGMAAGAALLSLRVIYLIARRQFLGRGAAIVSTLLLAICYPTLMEVNNGMETNLAALLLLLLFHVLTRDQEKGRVLFASLIGILLLLTRFEIPFALVFLGCGFWYSAYRRPGSRPSTTDLFRIAVAMIVCFFFITILRHREFGVWMPNTVYAKRFPPYQGLRTTSNFLSTRINAMGELFHVFGPAILVSVGLGVRNALLKRPSLGFLYLHPALFTLSLGCFLFGAVFGKNWGYDCRMVAPMMPFLILFTVGICVGSIERRSSLRIVFAILLITQGLLWLRRVVGPGGMTAIKTIEPLGKGAESIRLALHQERLLVMMADVGGSSLCCDRLEVIDSGFLADPILSHTGWPGFAPYLRRVRPELVEAHSFWAEGSGIYRQGLLDDYSIVASDGIRYFLRNDLFTKLIDERKGPVLPVTSEPACLSSLPEDAQFSLTKRTCLVLNGGKASRN